MRAATRVNAEQASKRGNAEADPRRLKQVQWPFLVFDEHIDEGVVDRLPDQ